MLWDVAGRQTDVSEFGSLRIDEVLNEFDGPRTFTLKDNFNDLYLAHFCDEDDEVCRFIVVPFNDDLLVRLTSGTISLLESLQQPRLWIVDCNFGWRPLSAWRSRLEDLPIDVLPERDVMLWPSLEPLLSVRTIGESIGEGTTPASVITDVVEGSKKAVKILVEHIREMRQLAGRPAEARRKWYDLPTQRIQFASFEVSFRMPPDDPQSTMLPETGESKEEVYQQVGNLLQRGFKWLLSGGVDPNVTWTSEEEKKIVLEAMESLIPSLVGPVKTLEVRGQLVSSLEHARGRPIQLNKNSKRTIRAALTSKSKITERIITESGYIRELDKDRFTFDLRKSPDDLQSSRKFSFDEDIAEEVNEAIFFELRVEVVGIQTSPQKPVAAKIVHPLIDDSAQDLISVDNPDVLSS